MLGSLTCVILIVLFNCSCWVLITFAIVILRLVVIVGSRPVLCHWATRVQHWYQTLLGHLLLKVALFYWLLIYIISCCFKKTYKMVSSLDLLCLNIVENARFPNDIK